jgi:voltage-gated potassium channel
MTIKRRAYEVLEGHRRDRASNSINLFIVALIGANLMVFTLSTVKPIYQSVGRIFDIFEAASVLAFTAEYSLRLWSCTLDERYSAPTSELPAAGTRGHLALASARLSLRNCFTNRGQVT